MEKFVARHQSIVTGVLSGFDRLVFRGTLPLFRQDRGMHIFLGRAKVAWVDWKKFMLATSERVKKAVVAEVERARRPIQYLPSPKTRKEDLAREILAERPLRTPGVVCAFTAVEPCMSFEYHRSKDPKARGLKLRPRKCQFIYKYYVHPTFGFMHARIQTWFPFDVQVYMNGREWLARDLRSHRSRCKQADNCFTWLANPSLAQQLMDKQLETEWPKELTTIARRLNPLHEEIFEPCPIDYYWSGYQTEWATDVVFESPKALDSIYPALVRYGIDSFKSSDVIRFLGRKANGHFTGELTTGFKDRAEGVRIKSWSRGNSIKMYNKAGSVLRVETTIARTDQFKVLRPPHDDPDGKLVWQPMRKGVADLHRRAEVSQAANARYLDALSVVDATTPCSKTFDDVSQPVTVDGRRFRAMRLGDRDDVALLDAISRGEFAINGFRNRDLRRLLYAAPSTKLHERRLSGRISRLLRLLRAHGIIRKVPKTHRYQLTAYGCLLTAALRATRDASIKQLLHATRANTALEQALQPAA